MLSLCWKTIYIYTPIYTIHTERTDIYTPRYSKNREREIEIERERKREKERDRERKKGIEREIER